MKQKANVVTFERELLVKTKWKTKLHISPFEGLPLLLHKKGKSKDWLICTNYREIKNHDIHFGTHEFGWLQEVI